MNNIDFSNYPLVLNVKDIQKIMSIGRRQAYELIHSEQFHTVRVGKSIKVAKQVFIDWLNGEKTA
ncbi:helix-turn-helix domain-containing protein [Radiobacillus deserti]|uniref:Helix-turn-helix domain-containing protein n=1 Tax=Radiobacillus deserti TaxID=2594883 RepID=A0A516KDC9_9BACI|nr:helix-turn-helix domain-containing protein [Radiobacillus deserti]QDP39367.1 helix-turn-helix domain-containing protein [Radiobacillus deserti]